MSWCIATNHNIDITLAIHGLCSPDITVETLASHIGISVWETYSTKEL